MGLPTPLHTTAQTQAARTRPPTCRPLHVCVHTHVGLDFSSPANPGPVCCSPPAQHKRCPTFVQISAVGALSKAQSRSAVMRRQPLDLLTMWKHPHACANHVSLDLSPAICVSSQIPSHNTTINLTFAPRARISNPISNTGTAKRIGSGFVETVCTSVATSGVERDHGTL